MSVPSLAAFFDHSTSLRITWLILHFLWQGLAIAAVVFIINLLVARKSPKLRYAVAVVGMVAMISSIATTWFLLQPTVPKMGRSKIAVPVDIGPAMESDAALAMIDLQPTPEPMSQLEAWAPAATAIYVIGVAIMMLRLLFSAIGVGRLQFNSKSASRELVDRVSHLSQQISLRLKPTLKTCDRVVVPFVAGVIKPAILLPSLLVTGMTQAELDAILLHELAHVRRGDLLVNFLQRIVESLLFFHPAVWYTSRVITVERENCCDDIVLRHCSQKVYASALIRLAEACADNSAEIEPIAALAATGACPSQLKRRVMRILGVKPTRQFHKPGFGVLLACIIAVTITAVHLQGQTNSNDFDAAAQAVADRSEPLSQSGVELGDVNEVAPLTISFGEGGNIVGFSVNDSRSMHRLSAIVHNLTARQGVVITSMNVRRNRSGLMMTVHGQNLDFAAIKLAIRKANAPRVEALIENNAHLERDAEASAVRKFRNESLGDMMILRGERMNETMAKSIVDEFKNKYLKDNGGVGFLGPIRIEAMGDAIMLRGGKQDLDRVVRIIQEIDDMMDDDTSNSILAAEEAELAERYGAGHPRRKTRQQHIQLPQNDLLEESESLERRSNPDLAAADPETINQVDEPAVIGPIQFEIFGDDRFIIRGDKEDVDRVMKFIQKNLDKNKPARRMSDAKKPEDPEPILTDPVRIEFIEGTDIFIVRGKKEDVDCIMQVIDGKSHHDDAEPKKEEGEKDRPKSNGASQLDFKSPLVDVKGQINEGGEKPLWVSYKLTNAIAGEFAEILREAFVDLISGVSEQKPLVKVDVENNKILVQATRKIHAVITAMMKDLDRGTKATEARHVLGVVIAPARNGKPGVLVRSVVTGTAAELAGIRVGDILLRYDDKVVTPKSLPKLVQQHENKSPKLTIDREGKEIFIQIDAESIQANAIRIRLLRESLTERDKALRQIVELKNQILELEAEDQRRKAGEEARIESLNRRIPRNRLRRLPFIDSHIFHGRTPQGQLRFPEEVERGMMFDAAGDNVIR